MSDIEVLMIHILAFLYWHAVEIDLMWWPARCSALLFTVILGLYNGCNHCRAPE